MATPSVTPPSSSPPPGSGQPPTPPPAPPPPEPKKICYGLVSGQASIAENPEKFDFLAKLIGILPPQIPKEAIQSISASNDAFGPKINIIINHRLVSFPVDQRIDQDPDLGPMAPKLREAVDYLTDPTGSIPVPSLTSPPTPTPPSGTPPAQSPGLAQPLPNAPPAAPPQPPGQFGQVMEGLDRLTQALQQHQQHQPPPPIIMPFPMGGGAAMPIAPGVALGPVANDPQQQGFLANYLREQVPRLERILPQTQGLANANLNLRILQIRQDPQPLTLQELQDCQGETKQLVFNYLNEKIQAMPPHLRQRLRGTLLPTLAALPAQSALLTNLLAAAAPHPLPGLDVLLAVETAIEQHLNPYLQGEITAIGLSLPPIEEALDLTAVQTELTAAAAPNLTRLIAIDAEITTAYRNLLTTKTQTLVAATANLQAPFAFDPNVPPAAAAIPAIVGQTREQLLLMPARILAQFDTYIRAQIALAQIPQAAQAPALLGPPAAAPTLTELLAKPRAILDCFNTYLNTHANQLPSRIKTQIQAMPATTVPELVAKHTQMQTDLTAYLRAKVVAENNVAVVAGSKRDQQRTAMLAAIGINGLAAGAAAPGTIAAILAELPAAAPPPPVYPNLERLNAIRAPLETFLEQQRYWVSRHPIYTMVALGAMVLLVYYLSQYCTVSTLGECLVDNPRRAYNSVGKAYQTVKDTASLVRDIATGNFGIL